jgi:hypothetical protein
MPVLENQLFAGKIDILNLFSKSWFDFLKNKVAQEKYAKCYTKANKDYFYIRYIEIIPVFDIIKNIPVKSSKNCHRV